MDTRVSHVNLQSMIDTHERPFVLIDQDFRIVAVNHAYEQAYGLPREQMVGQMCYQVSHHNSRPCFENGEDCPHQSIYSQGENSSCMHIHYDGQGKAHRVRISAYSVQGENGEMYMGEAIQELGEPDVRKTSQLRMVGESAEFKSLIEQLKLAAASHAPVLLQGETGTGKDLAANFIHEHSSRGAKPFLTLDCTVLTEGLFEAEVYGYERGAFTGSVGEKKGLLEVVDGGTVFLDEIGEIPLHLQAKLLRVLETGEFRRLGGHKTIHMNARIICATNRELGADIRARKFREDLYYRIACLHIRVPPLRDRLADIPCLTEALLDRIEEQTGTRYQFNAEAIGVLQRYNFPGNVRELRNIITGAAAQCGRGTVAAQEVATAIRRMESTRQHRGVPAGIPISGKGYCSSLSAGESTLGEIESGHISRLLIEYEGNRRRVAAALGICERTLYRKLKKYRLNLC